MSNLNAALHAPAPAILAQNHMLSCNTRQTGLNNNMLVIGPSGAGKTRNVLKPNLLQMNASYIVLDTKGTLCREVGPVLAAHGYRVGRLNFADLDDMTPLPEDVEQCGYNPLNHIRRSRDGMPNQQDIISVAKAICPVEDQTQPFWDHAAANLLSCLIAYVCEQLPVEEQTFSSVIDLCEHLQDRATARLFDDLQMPQIDSVLSIIRSREIWATLLLQSTNQLDALYGEARARSIMGNCDTQLVLAFQDPESARVFSERADVLPGTLMATPVDRSWLFVRGRAPQQVERFRLEDHPLYEELPEAQNIQAGFDR